MTSRDLDTSLLYTVTGRVQPGGPTTPPLPPAIVPVSHPDGLALRREVWVVPVLVIAAINLLCMLAFEAYVLLKVSRTSPSRRHMLLGQMLLLGLLTSSVCGAVYVLEPSPVSCAVIRLAVGLGYTLVYATLLVKCVFLYSLNSGVYLPGNYQALLLAFVCAVQLVIDAQWLLTEPPAMVFIDGGAAAGSALCSTRFEVHLLSLTYPALLLLLVACAGMKARHIQDNYREASYICAASVTSVLVWCAWTIGGLVAVRPEHQDAAVSLGLLVNSTLVFLIMFMSKSRQLAAVGKEVAVRAGEEDRVSFSYADPSGFSPSFYHFRPVKVQPAADMWRKHPLLQSTHGPSPYVIPRCSGYIRQEDSNVYNTIDHLKSHGRHLHVDRAHSSNPNVFFYRPQLHPGMLY